MFEKAKERLAKKKAAEAAAAAPGASSKSPAPVQAPNSIVLFHYPTSPIARRVVWYLKLRGLDYAECVSLCIFVCVLLGLETVNTGYVGA